MSVTDEIVIDETALDDIVEAVWTTTFDMPVVPVVLPGPCPDSAVCVSGFVQVSGARSALVVVHCPVALGRRMAARLLQTDEDLLTQCDVADAVGEAANMVGGNVKGMFAGSSRLGLPVVVEGSGVHVTVRGSRLVQRRAFGTGEHVFLVEHFASGA